MNSQPIEKLRATRESLLDVHSIFKTFQGEGPHTGRPSTFVRLAGCNLQCPMCDTEYTEGRTAMDPVELARVCDSNGPRLVVITGGEPFRQPAQLCALTHQLLMRGMEVQIETNGTLPAPMSMFIEPVDLVVSPKADKVQATVAEHAAAWKYVLDARSVSDIDGLPIMALGNHVVNRVARPPAEFLQHSRHRVYIQPADTGDDKQNQLNLQAAMHSCMQYGYTLQLQLHKILGVE